MKLILKEVRLSKNITQETLARLTGLSINTIKTYESRNKPTYTHDVLERICHVLDVHVGSLFTMETDLNETGFTTQHNNQQRYRPTVNKVKL